MATLPLNIDKAHIRELSNRSNLWGAWLTFHVWATIIISGAVFVIWPNPLTFVFAVLMIGSRQHGMAVLMHDAAHGILFRNRKINDFVGHYVLGAPYGGDMHSYRKYHLQHHKYTQTDIDPDLPLSAKFPVSRHSMMRKFLRDITGLTFIRLRIAAHKMRQGQSAGMRGTDAFQKSSDRPTIISNVMIFSVLAVMGLWWAYFALWLLPLMTWFWVVLRLRNIAEHAMTARNDSPLEHARTTKANLIERILFAPYWVNYHVEHHAYMYVPCYNLPKLHRTMLARGYGGKM
ncbi:MAG: fatty acid desaturase family protein, partial [Hyphomonadaceae bacterium]|nr:fatty acid desaturase family protein [Hyphomonadaceae bacterium]